MKCNPELQSKRIVGVLSSGKYDNKIITLVFVVYFLLIFEGAFRKWVFPQFHQIIFFIRDPFVLLIYLYALLNGKRLVYPSIFIFGLIMSMIFLVAGFFYIIYFDVYVSVILYGWRNYFFYIPLALIIGTYFKTADRFRLLRMTVYMSLPIAVIVCIQFYSPVEAFINKSISEDAFIFQVVDGIVRTTGTFTFTAAQAYFCGSLIAIFFANVLMDRNHKFLSRNEALFVMLTSLVCLLLSGSRTAFGLSGLVYVYCLLGSFTLKHNSAGVKKIVLLSVVVVVSLSLYPLVFPTSFDAMISRQTDAVSQEGSTIDRALRTFTDFSEYVISVPTWGYGIGVGTNGGAVVATGVMQFTLAEDEWSRIVLEVGPLLALIYIGFRIYLFFLLLMVSLQRVRVFADFTALAAFGFIGLLVLNGPLTMQGSMNGYGWIFTGLILSAAKK